MSRHKQKRVAAFLALPNTFDVIQKPPPAWADFFGDGHPIVLELGCGHGTYTTTLATQYPQYNYIGIDMKSPRMLMGARQAAVGNLTNVAFLRAPIEAVDECFVPESVAEIWIPFPDPYSKPSKSNQRLTAPRYLEIYHVLLNTNGVIHFKTDDSGLYQSTLASIKVMNGSVDFCIDDIDRAKTIDNRVFLRTPYEATHRKHGRKISYIRFRI